MASMIKGYSQGCAMYVAVAKKRGVDQTLYDDCDDGESGDGVSHIDEMLREGKEAVNVDVDESGLQ